MKKKITHTHKRLSKSELYLRFLSSSNNVAKVVTGRPKSKSHARRFSINAANVIPRRSKSEAYARRSSSNAANLIIRRPKSETYVRPSSDVTEVIISSLKFPRPPKQANATESLKAWCKALSEDLMHFFNAFKGEVDIRKCILATFNQPMTLFGHSNTAFCLIVYAAVMGSPKPLKTIFDAFKDDQPALAKWLDTVDFNQSVPSGTLFDLFVQLSMDGKPEYFKAIVDSFKHNPAAFKEKIKSIDFNQVIPNSPESTTLAKLALAAASGRPEVFMALLQAFEGDRSELKQWINALDFNQKVFNLLVTTLAFGEPAPLLTILNVWRDDISELDQWINKIDVTALSKHDKSVGEYVELMFNLVRQQAVARTLKPTNSISKDEFIRRKTEYNGLDKTIGKQLGNMIRQLSEASEKNLDRRANYSYCKLLLRNLYQANKLLFICSKSSRAHARTQKNCTDALRQGLKPLDSAQQRHEKTTHYMTHWLKCISDMPDKEIRKGWLLEAYATAVKLPVNSNLHHQDFCSIIMSAYVEAMLGRSAATLDKNVKIKPLLASRPGDQQSLEDHLNSVTKQIEGIYQSLQQKNKKKQKKPSRSNNKKRSIQSGHFRAVRPSQNKRTKATHVSTQGLFRKLTTLVVSKMRGNKAAPKTTGAPK